MVLKKIKYKGWLIQWNNEEEAFDLYTPEEMEQPAGSRYSEMTIANIDEAKLFIDKY